MTKEQIIQEAMDNFRIADNIEWKIGEGNLDGKLYIKIDGQAYDFNIEIKNELRSHALEQIYYLNQIHEPFMLVAYKIYPALKKQLQEHNIPYLEANGNFYLKTADKWLWIEANKPLKTEQTKGNRAFTKTGLKVVFEFMHNPELLNETYRLISEKTGTSAGNVTHIINSLKSDNFLLTIDKQTVKIRDFQALLIKWAEAYEHTLKPSLKVGSFRFVKEDDFYKWQEIVLETDKTLWGGEPAGDLLTNHLRPEILTLYTKEQRNDLMKKYRLIPDASGNVQIYKEFWNIAHSNTSLSVVSPLLVYADLMNHKNKRNRETAQMIYEKYIKSDI